MPSACDQPIQREEPGTEDQHQDCREQIGVWVRVVELGRLGENRFQCFAVGGEISHEHVAGEYESEQAVGETKDQQYAADEFEIGYEDRVQVRRGDAKTGEELCHAAEVV